MLAGLFERRDFRDPELAEAQITVTEVRIGPDLKHAIAFVSRLGRPDVDALLPALKRAAPYLRGQVAHALRLRFAPDLSFQPDHALDYAIEDRPAAAPAGSGARSRLTLDLPHRHLHLFGEHRRIRCW